MIWTLLPGAVFLADGCLKKKAEEELKENEQIPVCKGHIVLRKCHNRGVAGGGFAAEGVGKGHNAAGDGVGGLHGLSSLSLNTIYLPF